MSLTSLREIFTSFADTIRLTLKKWPASIDLGFESEMLSDRFKLSKMAEIWEKFRPYGQNLNFLLGFTAYNEKYTDSEDSHTLELDNLFKYIRINHPDTNYSNGYYITKIKNNGLSEIPEYFAIENTYLEEADLTGLSQVGGYAFNKCTGLKKVTGQLQRINQYAFSGCSNLEEFDFSEVNYIKVSAFSGTGLINITLPKWNWIHKGNINDSQFAGCTKLTSVDYQDNTSDIPIGCFYNCSALTTFSKGGKVNGQYNYVPTSYIGYDAFYGCSSLESIHFMAVESIGARAFQNCTSLTQLKITHHTGDTITSLGNADAFKNTPIANGTGYIYVDDDLVEDFKTGINWSVYADQIKPISELEE